MKTLIWNPKGCGEHYGGPGMSIFRTYFPNRKNEHDFLLAHGNPCQADNELFSSVEMVHRLYERRMRYLNQVIYILKGLRWLKQNSNRFDIFFGLTAFHNTVCPASYVANTLNKPAFVRVAAAHADLAERNKISTLLGLVKARRKKAAGLDGIIAISEEIRDELAGYGIPENRIFVVPNGVDTIRFSPADRTTQEAIRTRLNLSKRFTILFVGALFKRKQPHAAIEAVAKCVAKGYDAQLVLLGPMPEVNYGESLHRTAAKLKIADRIIFRNFEADPADYYRAADVFLLPSRKEGMSNAMLEAAASGLPVIIGQVSGAKALIKNNNCGKIVDASSTEQTTEAIVEYIKNPDHLGNHSKCARRTIEENFSSSFVFKRHMEIFKEAIARKSLLNNNFNK